MPATPLSLVPRDGPLRVLVWAGVAACIAGLVLHRLWEVLPWARSAENAAIAGLVALPAWALVRLRRMPWATALALAWGLAMTLHAGLLPVLAVVSLVAACLAAGSLLVADHTPALGFVAGAAVIAGIAGWLLPVRLHFVFVYLPVVLALMAWRRHALRGQLRALRAGWSTAIEGNPRLAAWGVVAIGIASIGTWLPTMQHDDLAYHLGLPWQLALHGRYALDPTHQVWALAPWGGDILHAIAQVLAGSEARGPLNAAWLCAATLLLWRACAVLGVSPPARWAALILFGSLPLLPALTAGMQTELPATAATLALAVLAFDAPRGRAGLYLLATLTGFLFALKLMHPVAASALLLLAAWRMRGIAAAHPAHVVGAAALLLLLGASSYTYAAVVSGNPVLPLLNGTFGSPYFAPVDFVDLRWQDGGPGVVWRLTFDTSRHLEGWDGGFGFVPIALAGALVAALLRPGLRLAGACAFVALLLPLAMLPYARYAFVGLVLLIPVAVAGAWAALGPRAGLALVLAVALLDFAFTPNANWLLHTGAPKRALLAAGRDAPLLERYAAERLVHARIRRERPAAVVLDLSGATHAELAGAGRTATWYAPGLHVRAAVADRDPTGQAWAALLQSEGVTDVISRPASLSPARRAGLAIAGGNPILTLDDVEWRPIPSPDAR